MENKNDVKSNTKTIGTVGAGCDKALSATTFAVMALIAVCSLLLVVLPKKDFSENENRYLASFPKLTAESFFSGQYMEELNIYLEDHFPVRDFWIGVKSETELLMGRNEINGIYLADGFLLEEYPEPQSNQRITDTFAGFAEKINENYPEINMRLLLAPTSTYIYRDMLPFGAHNADQRYGGNSKRKRYSLC